MESLRDALVHYSDEMLLDQYFNHKEDYTEEALKIMAEELQKRNLSTEEEPVPEAQSTDAMAQIPELYSKEDFTSLEHRFSKVDVLTAYAMLRDSGAVFYIDTPEDSSEEQTFTVHVLKSNKDEVSALLEEHFSPAENGMYALKNSDVKSRLKSFSFYDVHFSEKAAKEKLDVSFSQEESAALVTLGQKLLSEAEQIEQQQERVIFFYDSVEPLIEKLESGGRAKLTRTDLLAILEICQVYCDDPQFPAILDQTASALLSFIYGQDV